MKRLLSTYLAIVMALLCVTSISAQGYDSKSISVKDRLISNNVRSVVQDPKGFLWFGTDLGLCRYDGYKTEPFLKSRLSDGAVDDIFSMFIDRRGCIWINTENRRIEVFDTQTLTFREPIEELSKIKWRVNDFVDDGENIWMTTEVGVFRYNVNRRSVELFVVSDNPVENKVRSIYIDRNDVVWVSLWLNGVARFDSYRNSFVSYPICKEANNVSCFFEDGKSLYVGTWQGGVFRLDNPYDKEMVRYRKFRDRKLDSSVIYSTYYDPREDRLWLGTSMGLYLSDGCELDSKFVKLQCDDMVLPEGGVFSILSDRLSGNLWFGTYGRGAIQLTPRSESFNLYTLPNSPNGIVSSIFEFRDDLLVGLRSHTMMVKNLDSDVVRDFKAVDGYDMITNRANTINDIIDVESSRELWFATRYMGIVILKYNDRGEFVDSRNYNRMGDSQLRSNEITALCEDRQGVVWIGTTNGLNYARRDDRGVWTIARYDRGGVVSMVSDIVEDADGEIWVATNRQGIFRIGSDRESVEVYNTIEGEKSCIRINTMYVDSLGTLWVGTPLDGLLRVDKKRGCFVTSSELISMTINSVLSIVEDDESGLWIATGRKLINYIPSSGRSAAYDVELDVKCDGFTPRTAYRSKDGKLYFGTHKGLCGFDPNALVHESSFPSVEITDVRIFDRSILMEPDAYKTTPNGESTITIAQDDYSFTVEFSTLQYSEPQKSMYRCRLDGFDKEWVYVESGRNSVQYNNLRPGVYMLNIQGTNLYGEWGSDVTKLAVRVRPAPYNSWWAWLIYVTIIASILAFISSAVVQRVRLRNSLKISRIEKEGVEKLNNAKLQFFTNISHELLTPLSILSCSLDKLTATDTDNISAYNIMRNNVSRLLRLIEQILEFRKAESGNLKLKVSRADVMFFVQRICNDSFLPLIEKKRIRFSVNCHPSSLSCWFDGDKLDKIMYNLLSNAFKYNREGGEINVSVTAIDESIVRIEVRDRGEGIVPNLIPNIFNRFYDGEYRNYGVKGTGIGLSLTKDLVTLHKGEIKVESVVGEGTTFIVELPIERGAFDESQIDEESQQLSSVVEVEEVRSENEASEERATVLLVEDDKELLAVMSEVMSLDYNVITAEDGVVGSEMAIRHNPDIIISDIMMPNKDGYTMCGELKQNFETSHIPIILLTAKINVNDHIEGLQTGADAYLTKPFNMALLKVQVNTILKNRDRLFSQFRGEMREERFNTSEFVDMDQQFLSKAVEVVETHIGDHEFDTQQFYEEMNVSNSTLYRKIKSLTGLSPNEFIRNVRMKYAGELMMKKGYEESIAEIAYMVGYSSPRYFSVCFKKEFGETPSEWISRNSGSEEV